MPSKTARLWGPASRAPFVLLPLLFLSCSEGTDSSTDPFEPADWVLAPEPKVTIGQVEGEAEYLFSRIGPAALLPDGRIAVADQQDAAIRLFLPDGTFVREIGRRGEGPGEFSHLRTITVVPPDTIVTHDSRLFRLTRFLTSGSLVSTLRLQADDGMPEIYLGEYSTGELGFAWIKRGSGSGEDYTRDLMQFAKFSETGRLSALLGTEVGILRAETSPLAFSPHLYAEMIGDSLFLTNGLLPEIQVWDHQGGLVRTIHVPVPEADHADAWEQLEELLAARGNTNELQWFENQPRDVAIPRISMMLVDDQDRLWVKKYDPHTDNHLLMRPRCRGGEWLILEASGAVVATIKLPEDLLLLDVRGDQVLGQIADELGVERVQVYQIVGSN